jgi:hypothetical protein
LNESVTGDFTEKKPSANVNSKLRQKGCAG